MDRYYVFTKDDHCTYFDETNRTELLEFIKTNDVKLIIDGKEITKNHIKWMIKGEPCIDCHRLGPDDPVPEECATCEDGSNILRG